MSFSKRLAELQSNSPSRFVAVSFALGLASIPVIVGIPGVSEGLTLNSDFTSMLPESAPSVQDLDEVRERFGGQQSIVVVSQSDDIEGLHDFVRRLAPKIAQLEGHQVVDVDWNLGDYRDFVEENRHLYLGLEDLTAIRDALQARLDRERAAANPFFIDLEEEDRGEEQDPEELLSRIRQEADDAREEMDDRFPDGFLQNSSSNAVLIVVHTRIRGGELEATEALRDAVAALAEETRAEGAPADLEMHYGGMLLEVREETLALIAAVRDATALTIILVMLAIFIFFRKVRSIPILGLSLMPPVLITFAFAEVTVDYLNASSAFLSAIVVGNGINPNVIWLSRYFELRREGHGMKEALYRAQTSTWRATLAASLAAGIAYASLISTDYRGFRDFGIVGGTGMLLCWIGAHLLLPALTAQFERWRPMKVERPDHKGVYGEIFAKLALGWPRAVLACSLVATVVLGGVAAWAIANDPMEYDFRKLRTDRDPDSDVSHAAEAGMGVVDDTRGGYGLAVLATDREDAIRIRDWLEAHRDEFPHAYGHVSTIEDLLPDHQAEKLPIIEELRGLMQEVRPFVDEETQRTIDEQMPPEGLHELVPADLPTSVARPFTERDGSRGRLVVMEHHPEENNWDGRYFGRWSEAARAIPLASGEGRPPVAGTAVVFADLLHEIWHDGPRTIGISLLATVLLVLFAFRRARERIGTVVTLLVGILWMAGTMALFGMKLNMLNFIAFPITFGNGADYGVNVMRRISEETNDGVGLREAVRRSVEGTGGAVVLCSLTTVIGYLSIYTSRNQGLNSFGLLMAISEITCLAAALLALPAAFHLLAGRTATPHAGAERVSDPTAG